MRGSQVRASQKPRHQPRCTITPRVEADLPLLTPLLLQALPPFQAPALLQTAHGLPGQGHAPPHPNAKQMVQGFQFPAHGPVNVGHLKARQRSPSPTNAPLQSVSTSKPTTPGFTPVLADKVSAFSMWELLVRKTSSHSGGVTRYVLPYNQVPAHYHKLLGFPRGLQASMGSPTATTTGLLSPSSTTSLLHPEEENSCQVIVSRNDHSREGC